MAIKFLLIIGIVTIILILLIAYCSNIRNKWTNCNQTICSIPSSSPAPVVVTTTTIPVPPAGYPQNTAVPGLHMPQPQPMYVQQTAYPHSPNATAPYPDAHVPVDMNPPSYDQVVRGIDAYQKPLPYNPNFAGQL